MSHAAICDGNRSVSGETATPTGAVFIIKCDFHHSGPDHRKRNK